ncbi:hypothetical protein SAMN06265339_0839 [Desulfurobacterium pacificum]|uniref:Gram-positive cocci surface proteins LPxTG domain-containing protein n=1 Tax=Desulfurobacterium pacificum TaxID=240166 RepID=A0ABY1NJW0_9BACT|nr:hypothetical protein [Desulfurobacterium pacificum]SMP10652.1 hypothetical protein SAMN06265339_0839 [Desulfurobacterium pacificum]
MKKLAIYTLFIFLFLPTFALTNKTFAEDKPVEAWITKEKIGNREVEVIKIRTESGKIIEVAPGLTREEIPKPVNKLPEGTSKKLLYLSGGLVVGLGIGVLLMKYLMKKEKARS